MPTKVVINRCFGGFSLSPAGRSRLAELDPSTKDLNDWDLDRTLPALVQTVEELGGAAAGRFSSLGIVEIPDDVSWHLAEYDGAEHVAENHRTWY